METDKQEEIDMKLLENHANQLMEHFDTVQIFATRNCPSEGGTVDCQMGKGNWFARYGQIGLWLDRQIVEHTESDKEE